MINAFFIFYFMYALSFVTLMNSAFDSGYIQGYACPFVANKQNILFYFFFNQ